MDAFRAERRQRSAAGIGVRRAEGGSMEQSAGTELAETAASAGPRPSARRPCSRSSAGSSRSTVHGWRSPTRWATATTPWRASTWTPDRGVPLRSAVARDIEVTGTDRARPPLSPSDLPYPAEELPTWAECLLPAGIHEALGVALFAPEGGGTSATSRCCPAAGSHRPRPRAAGCAGSRRCSRTASTRCVRCSPPRAWCGGPRPAWCCPRRRLPAAARPRRRRAARPAAPPSWSPHMP